MKRDGNTWTGLTLGQNMIISENGCLNGPYSQTSAFVQVNFMSKDSPQS